MKNYSITLLCYLILLVPFGLLAQEGAAVELPKVAPVSPEAASLGKYGDLPVNLASGRINYSIPIFTIQEAGFELPIYLSYNHSGLLAEEDPGLVGLGWTLHAGGMIVRQLRGKPDESSLGYVGGNIGSDLVIPYYYQPSSLSSSEIFNLLEGSESGRLDTQPDKFVINAGNLSGNFSYNELGEAIFYPHKNYKIQSNNGYIVTDDNGVIYTFNSEETTSSLPVGVDEVNNPVMDYVSGWGLTKIEFPTSNRTIDIEYTQGSTYEKEGFTESKSIKIASNGVITSQCAALGNPVINESSILTTVFKQQMSRITFSQGSIEFDIRTPPNGSLSKSNYLHSIIIKNVNNEIINTYEFVFDNLMSNFKLLEEVKKYGKDGEQIPFFNLEYNNVPPAQINYTSQDAWGYYNGKSNTNLINGDRSVDLSKSSLGALKKIIYPTGGYSELQYESNKSLTLQGTYQDLIENNPITTQTNAYEEIDINTINSSDSRTFTLPVSQLIKVTLKTRYDAGNLFESEAKIVSTKSNGDSNLECNSYNTAGDNCYTIVETYVENGDANNGSEITENKSYINYFFVDANYPITISAGIYDGSFDAAGRAQVRVDYYDPNNDPSGSYNEIVENGQTYIEHEVGGLRIKSTKDCNEPNDCINKTYNYQREDGVTSGSILSLPIYGYEYQITDLHSSCTIAQYSSSSKIPLASFQGAPVLYNRVETLNNDDETNGKTVKYFTSYPNPQRYFPFAPAESKDWKKGNLKKDDIQTFKNNQLSLIKAIDNIHQSSYPYLSGQNEQKRSLGMAVGKDVRDYYNGVEVQSISNYTMDFYNNRPEFYHLTESTVSEHNNGATALTQQTNYSYDNLTGYPKETTTTDSDGDVLKSITTYPTSGTLITQNRLNTPIKNETFNGSDIISKQITEYGTFGNYYLPNKIKTAKGTDTEKDRIEFKNYDADGNILQVAKTNGMDITYIYGYNNTLPIAKIENATYAQVGALININNLQSKSNADNDRTMNYNGNEGLLRQALDDIRTLLPNAMVTTYTYDPLIGVTSITSPKGYTIYYEYDDLYRLLRVNDEDGKIMSENKYHYKTN